MHEYLDTDDCSQPNFPMPFAEEARRGKPHLSFLWIESSNGFREQSEESVRLVLVQQLLRCRERRASVFLRHCGIPGEWVTPRLCRSFQYLGLNEL